MARYEPPHCPACQNATLIINTETPEFYYMLCVYCYYLCKHRKLEPLMCDRLRDKLPYGDGVPEI